MKYKKVNKCICCNRKTLVFIWTTSRAFTPYKTELSNLLTQVYHTEPSNAVLEAINFGLPVCSKCFNTLKHGGHIDAEKN